ncbi:hypothetical protein [Morganella morganii]|uniref:hypothetical protein n=1 Tax=Morganella morganii TaxID=582 RepID=UPI003F70D974
MSGLTLYTNAMSRGNTVDLFLKILDVPYQRVELDYGADMHVSTPVSVPHTF